MPSATDSDDKAWQAAMAHTKPLRKKRTVPPELTPEQLAKKPIKPKAPFVARAASAAREYDARLDLHGQTESGAHSLLMGWVEQQIKRGARRLLVVTGKGASKGGSAIRDGVPRWLEASVLGASVSGIEPAPAKFGGDGAYLIKLKKPK